MSGSMTLLERHERELAMLEIELHQAMFVSSLTGRYLKKVKRIKAEIRSLKISIIDIKNKDSQFRVTKEGNNLG